MGTLFRDERLEKEPETITKIKRIITDFPRETSELESIVTDLASMVGFANTKVLVESLLADIESRADIPR